LSIIINYKNIPVALVGRKIKTDMKAPDFVLIADDLSKVRLGDCDGKIKILTSFLSLDTSGSDLQVKEYEKRASSITDDVVVLGISNDLPFAQKRFCQSNSIEKVRLLSDYRYSSFGINYGLLIKELNLLASAIVILDKNNNIRYFDILDEATDTPDFDMWLSCLEQILTEPSIPVDKRLPYKCIPCEAGVLPFVDNLVEKYMKEIKDWKLINKRISKTFKFKDFVEAKYFIDLLAIIAEEQGHHPDLKLWYNKLDVELTTHAIGGLSENDFIMAKIIDELEV